MPEYQPHSTVLDYFTDEALRAETLYKGDAARELLRLPSEWRQTCEAAVHQRAYRTTHGGGGAQLDEIRDVDEVRSVVIGEILSQLSRERSRG